MLWPYLPQGCGYTSAAAIHLKSDNMQIGQKVECINDGGIPPYPKSARWRADVPVKGAIYTVTGIMAHSLLGFKCLLLAEIKNTDDHSGAYRAIRFRPVVGRQTDISVFTAMLNKERV